MCCRECAGNLSSNVQGFSQVKARAREKLAEGFTLYILHRNEVDTIHAIHFVDMSHTGMAQRCGSFGLLDKPAQLFRVAGKLGIEQLERDFAMEFGILSEEDLTHPAGAEWGENLVGGKSCSYRRSHQRRTLDSILSYLSIWQTHPHLLDLAARSLGAPEVLVVVPASIGCAPAALGVRTVPRLRINRKRFRQVYSDRPFSANEEWPSALRKVAERHLVHQIEVLDKLSETPYNHSMAGSPYTGDRLIEDKCTSLLQTEMVGPI